MALKNLYKKINKIKSYAKINLALNILGKNSRLHKIESIVAFVSLHDVIYIKKIKNENHKISFYGQFSKKIDKNNTISKLLKILEKRKLLKNIKFEIQIDKRIPSKSGLGGGSMNAANILRFFIKKRIIKISKKKLNEICKSIGSDVILGLNSKNSILTPQQEIFYFKRIKRLYTLIVMPNFGCSTKDIFSRVKVFSKAKFSKPNNKMFNIDFLKKTKNDLEPVAFAKYSKLRLIKHYLENLFNPDLVRMSGSGSALVAYYLSKERCENAKKKFKKKYKNYWCIASKTI